MFSRSDIRELFTLYDEDGVDEDLPECGTLRVSDQQDERELVARKDKFWSSRQSGTSAGREEEGEEVEAVVGAEAGSGSSSDVSSSRDKRLLKALWDGEAITGVYDHEAAEPCTDTGSRRQYRQLAERAVEGAVGNLRASTGTFVAADTSPRRFGLTRHANSSATDNGSAALLRGRTGGSIDRQNIINYNVEFHGTPEASMLPRLQKIIRSHEKLTSQQVLDKFGPLDDKFAPLFRETLRRVARFENGTWSRR